MSIELPTRFEIGKLTVVLLTRRNNKVLVARNDRGDLPHLLISFNNPSGEIDVHLSKRKRAGKPEYFSIAKIPEKLAVSILSQNLNELREHFIKNMKNVSPISVVQLSLRKYKILYLSPDNEAEITMALVVNKKRRGSSRRFFNMTNLEQIVRSKELGDYVFDPSILRSLMSQGVKGPVFAFRRRSGNSFDIIPLGLIRSADGKANWLRLDGIIKTVGKFANAIVMQFIDKAIPDNAGQMIREGLALHELE